ncbi:MAG: hypothetical protein HY332_15005 [Chloroflexi bacterium]|nr:hypothetical protein [Chloroflexota bacterium]
MTSRPGDRTAPRRRCGFAGVGQRDDGRAKLGAVWQNLLEEVYGTVETTARIDRLEDALIQLATAQRELVTAQERTEARLGELTAAQERTEMRLGQLAAAQERTEARLSELATAQRDLAAAQERTESRLGQLAAAQERTETQLGALLSWQRGEDGRRRGERLEREVLRGAPTLFSRGRGGSTDQEHVRQHLIQLLGPILDGDLRDVPPEADPFLADLLWWKGDHVALVEVSWVVDEYDVQRAYQRAETLRRAGVTVLPVVIGDSWANGEVRALAVAYRMGWRVGGDLSDAYIDFRRLPDTGSATAGA